jgi:hypothetical protein
MSVKGDRPEECLETLKRIKGDRPEEPEEPMRLRS